MGANQINYQIKIHGSFHDRVEHYRRNLERLGYTLTDETQAHRTLQFLHRTGSQWMVLLERGAETMRVPKIKQTARELSSLFAGTVIGAQVLDSDVLVLYADNAILRKRNLLVLDNGNPGYAAELGYSPKNARGNASLWCELTGVDRRAALLAAWRKPYVMAEDALRDIGALLELDTAAGTPPGGGEDVTLAEILPEGYEIVTLYMKKSGLPPVEIVTDGLPDFYLSTYSSRISWGELNLFSFRNQGGPSTGVIFALLCNLSGTVEMMQFSEVEISTQKDPTAKHPSRPGDFWVEKRPFQFETKDGQFMAYARFEDFPIHEGVRMNSMDSAAARRHDALMDPRLISVSFSVSAVKSIHGQTFATLLALASPIIDPNNGAVIEAGPPVS